jgi:ABC-type glycerol-3-phosphate transport system substrate-binding protein
VVVATPAPQVAPEGAATVTFSAYGANPSDLRRLARAFHVQHPELYIQINLPGTFTAVPSPAQIALTSDCFGWPTLPRSEDDFNALLDLRPLFDADASFPIADYWPTLLSLYEHKGRLAGVPYAATLCTLNYNKTAFEAAGITPPTYAWTPDDFMAAAQALTKGTGENKQYGYVALNGAQQDLQFFVGQFGGQLTTGSGVEIRPTFTDPKTIAAIRWYLDLAAVHQVMPPLTLPYKPGDIGSPDRAYEYVQSGRAGMWFDQGYGIFGPPAASGKGDGPGGPPLNFEVGLAPLPIGRGGLAGGDLNLRGLHISAQTQQAQGCWEWIKFLSGDLSNLYGSIPARRSVLESEAFKQQATPEIAALADTYATALAQDRGQSNTNGAINGFEALDPYWFYKALNEAIAGTTPLEQGLADAQQFSTAFMECLAKSPNKLATCAKQVDPTYDGFTTQDPAGQPGTQGSALANAVARG